MLRWSWLAAMQITAQVPDLERWSVIGGDLEITPLLLAACASLYLMELSTKPVGSKVKNTVVHQKKTFHALDILLLMWKCCLVLIELPLQQHSHKFSLASKERLWNPLKLTETEWKHTFLEVGKMGELDLWVVIWAIRPLSVSLWALQNHFTQFISSSF